MENYCWVLRMDDLGKNIVWLFKQKCQYSINLANEIDDPVAVGEEIENIQDQEAEESGGERKAWSRKAIILLIELYKKYQKEFRNTTIKNGKVWDKIKQTMSSNGFQYTTIQIENKFKYLKARYVKVKDNGGTRGTGESPIRFQYFEEFDDIFACSPNIKPVSEASSLYGCPSTSSSSTNSDIETPPKKKE